MAFRTQDPDGENVVLAEDITRTFTRSYGTLKVRFESQSSFIDQLTKNAVLTGIIGSIYCQNAAKLINGYP